MIPELRAAIFDGQSTSELENLLRSTGTASLEQDAMAKTAAGIIGFEEAIGIRWLS